MDKQVDAEIRKELDALCKKVSVAHKLDLVIQEELHGHMEDKLEAYLNGEEKLSERDAFILVREHFGDPAALKGLLRDVHAYEANVSLARRLAAAYIVMAGVSTAYVYLTGFFFQLWPAARGLSGIAVFITVTAVLPWLLLLRWQHRLYAGHTPWFLTWDPGYLISCAAILFMLQILRGIPEPGIDGPVQAIILAPVIQKLIMGVILANPVFQCMVWIWWCDRPPRKASTLGKAAGFWVLWLLISALTQNIARGTASGMSGWSAYSKIISIGSALLLWATYSVIAIVLYMIGRHVYRRFHRDIKIA